MVDLSGFLDMVPYGETELRVATWRVGMRGGLSAGCASGFIARPWPPIPTFSTLDQRDTQTHVRIDSRRREQA